MRTTGGEARTLQLVLRRTARLLAGDSWRWTSRPERVNSSAAGLGLYRSVGEVRQVAVVGCRQVYDTVQVTVKVRSECRNHCMPGVTARVDRASTTNVPGRPAPEMMADLLRSVCENVQVPHADDCVRRSA